MKLRELKEVIDKAVACSEGCDPDVEIWVGKKRCYKIGSIGQFNLVPDVTITVGEKIYDVDA